MQDLLDWNRLHCWAQQKAPNSVLGQSCTNSLCPLASYLNEATGGQHWSVGPAIKNMGTGQRLDKSAWITNLIEKTDESTGKTKGPVSREQFLAVLESIREE